jgi:hypothetical protein
VTSRVGGTDRIYVGFNDLSVFPGKTATVRLSTDNGTTWNNVVIERLTPGAGQDGPPIRLAASSDGSKVYAAFLRWTAFTILRAGSQTRTSQVTSLSSGRAGAGNFNALRLTGSMLQGNVTFHSVRKLGAGDGFKLIGCRGSK